MKLRWMTSAAVTLGLCAVAPTMARADRFGGDRDRGPVVEVRRDHEDRYDRGREIHDRRDFHERDCDDAVGLPRVPRRVVETAERAGNGRHIESVRFIRRDGLEFYKFDMQHHGWKDLIVRVAPDGCLLNAEK